MAILFDPTDMPPTGRLLHTGSEGLESCRGVSTLLSLDTAHHHNRLIQPHKPGHGLYWTTDVTCELPVRVAESGPGSLPPITVVDFFADTVRRYPERPALAFQPHFVPKVTAGRSSSSSSAKDEEEKRREQEEGKEEKDDGGTILTSLPARPNLDTAPPPSYVCGPIPGWCMYTWQGYWNDVCMFAKGLLYLGCERRSRIAIMGCNSPAWAIAYFGSIFIDGVAVGVYTTNSVDATRHVVRHARCRVAVVDSLVNLEKMLQVKKLQQKQREERALRKLHGPYSNSTKKSDIDKNEAGQAQQDDDPSRKRKRDTPSSSSSSLRQMNQGGGAGLGRRENQGGIASKEEKEEEEEAELGACDELQMIVVYRDRVPPGYENDGVISFEDFLQLGLSVNDAILTARMESLKPGQCCSLVYTSGTTGYPKGVMLSHDNFTWTAACSSQMMKLDSSHHLVSFLPLSHVAAQLVDLYMPVTMGCCAYFARPDSLQGTLIETVKAVRPTWFLAVPRVWEKIELKLKEIAAQRGSTGLKKRIADWAKDVGYRGTDALLTGKDGAVPTTFPIVMKLILNQVRKALGMDRCLGLGSCAAPLDPVTQRYFMSLGMPINSIYGLSESTGPQTFILPAPGWFKVGSIGHALPGTDMLLANQNEAGEGEICFRGRNIFMGYYKDEKSTRGTLDENGFLHTGDLGSVDDEGFIYLTGRLKELIITAGGENVPPLLLESLIKQELPGAISNCMVIGDRRKFLSCLVCLTTTRNKEDDQPTNLLAPEVLRLIQPLGSRSVTTQEAQEDSIVNGLLKQVFERTNQKTISRAQFIQGWRILPIDFSVATGELTATMKLRRKFVEGKYASLVEEIYNKSAIPPCIAAQTSKTANHPGGGEQEATPTEESRDIQICSSHGKEAKKREGGEEDPKELLHRQQPPTKRMAKL